MNEYLLIQKMLRLKRIQKRNKEKKRREIKKKNVSFPTIHMTV